MPPTLGSDSERGGFLTGGGPNSRGETFDSSEVLWKRIEHRNLLFTKSICFTLKHFKMYKIYLSERKKFYFLIIFVHIFIFLIILLIYPLYITLLIFSVHFR